MNSLSHIQLKSRRSNDIYIILGFWIFVTLLFITRSYLSGNIDNPISIVNFLYEFSCLSPWVFAVLIIKSLNDRLTENDGIGFFLLHVFLALIIFLIHSTFQTFVNSLYMDQASFGYEIIKADFIYFFDIRLLLYIGILIGYRYDKYFYKKGQILLRKEKLKTELERTKLSSIIYDVQPDFLIKNIDELSFFIYQDTNRAKDLLVTLSDLIRLLVRYSKKDSITLEEDIKIYKYYVEFLSLKIDQEIKFIPKYQIQHKASNIPKTFFTIPLIDSIIDKCNGADLYAFQKIFYTFETNEETTLLEIRISDIPSIRLDDLKETIQEFKDNILKSRFNSYDIHIDSINKFMDQILISIRFD